MVTSLISRLFVLVFGLLFPAYRSYKTIKAKNAKHYVKWLVYWIVFSLFTCIEFFTDFFFSWFPFYYELKILFVIWLLSPWTRGATILFTKVVHPQLSKHEKEIDQYISKASEQASKSFKSVSSKGIGYVYETIASNTAKLSEKNKDTQKTTFTEKGEEIDIENTDD